MKFSSALRRDKHVTKVQTYLFLFITTYINDVTSSMFVSEKIALSSGVEIFTLILFIFIHAILTFL